MPSRTCRASAARSASSTSDPGLVGDLDAHRRDPAHCARLRRCGGDCFAHPGVVAFIGVHDVPHQPVPHHVVAGQPGEVHVIQAFEDILHDPQAAGLAGRQVHLGDVAGHDDLGGEAEPGQEHLHLFRGGVLRLVQDDERVVEGPAAHVRERRHLDRARRDEPRDRFRVEHVMQRVVQRPQVGVDLLVQGARQEAQPLPRLDGRPGQDDPVDLLGLQRLHRLGHGQVGLAGARRADAEHDGVRVDGVHVTLLVQRFGADCPPARRQDVQGQHVSRAHAGLAAQHGHDPLHRIGGELGAARPAIRSVPRRGRRPARSPRPPR